MKYGHHPHADTLYTPLKQPTKNAYFDVKFTFFSVIMTINGVQCVCDGHTSFATYMIFELDPSFI